MRLELRVAELPASVGVTLGPSEWRTVTQEQIELFARATGDFQWIHVDVERASAGPFGAPIAHGYLTLALCPALLDEVFAVVDKRASLNYGLDRVRFPRPLRSGRRVRLSGTIADVRPVDGGVQAWLELVVHADDDPEKPVCAATSIVRYLG